MTLAIQVQQMIRDVVAKDQAATSVQMFARGTVVRLFLLAGRLPTDSWDGK